MHFFAGVEGSVHDLEVFRRTLNDPYRLLEDHSNEPTKILADKGYISFNDSLLVKLVTAHKKRPHEFLSDAQVRSNQRLSSARVVVQNYFGRLATRFHIMVRRWGFDDAFYLIVFGICCALANYDILLGGGALQSAEGNQYGAMLTRICTKGKDSLPNARERMQRRPAHRRSVREAQTTADREEAHDREEDEQRAIAAFGHPEDEGFSEAED
jgi:hypothetical protein